jgi:Fe-S cluster biosynthesis and repair protein YggX
MSTISERISQFEHMAAEDPDNDMAHFSLGTAYLQAGRSDEAASAFSRCIELNADMSKAYQLAGQALIDAGREAEALEVLKRGHEVAVRRGDMMPRRAIAGLLQGLGHEPPSAQEPAAERGAPGAFICRYSGSPGTRLPGPPMRGPLGQWVFDNISAESWRLWIAQGTKVINELRLDFSREEDQRAYDRFMCEFLGIEPDLYESLTGGAP